MNTVILVGRMCADPELKKTNGGKSVTAFTIAVSRGKDATDFLDCVSWEKTAEFICQYFKKGSPIAAVGAVQTRTYQDKEGKNRKAVEISVKNAEFVPRSTSAEGQEQSFGQKAGCLPPNNENALESRTVAQGAPEDFEVTDFGDEDLPF